MKRIKIIGGPGSNTIRVLDSDGKDISATIMKAEIVARGGRLAVAKLTMFAELDLEAVVIEDADREEARNAGDPRCVICGAPAETIVSDCDNTTRVGSEWRSVAPVGTRSARCFEHENEPLPKPPQSTAAQEGTC